MQSTEFLKRVFSDFYRREAMSIGPPSAIEKREFGFLSFVEGRMFRHKGFDSVDELRSFFENAFVSDAYYSCAYYEVPEAEMEKKGWVGADLVFDIDADHIPTPCGKIHDEWTCCSCGFVGKGLTPEECPSCQRQKFDVKTWPCEKCLDSAKAETVKLLDMLMRDFGFSEKEIHVFFSGHRGYHVHVEGEAVRTLDAVARKEIVDYVCGLGLDTGFGDQFSKGSGKVHLPSGPRLGDFGWRGRIARGLYDFIFNAGQEDYERMGLKKNFAKTIVQNRDSILKSWDDVGPYKAIKGVGFETWKRIAESCVKLLSAKIDTVVTTDIHRLIRLTGTLHGKTGLKKVEFPISSIEVFDPFKAAVAFKKGTVTVSVSDAPEFRLGDETFGPYKNSKVELPTAAAVLLVCKGRAKVVE